jgi:hypothetical protein
MGPMLELANRRWLPDRINALSSTLWTQSGATYRQAELSVNRAHRVPPDWTVTPYGPLILAARPDPAAWFTDPDPDPALVETTRTALGSLVALE